MRCKVGAIVLAASAAVLPGCNVVGPVAYLIHGPDKVGAVHTLEPARPTVVFVDDANSRLPSRSLRVDIASAAEKYLLREECLKDMITNRSAVQAASEDRLGTPLSIIEIGQKVNAEVVIYVEMQDFGISPDGQTFSPFATARVKVMDVKAGKRVWPEQREGWPVLLKPTPQPDAAPTTLAARLEASRLLANEVGKAVAQLFYTHELQRSAGNGELKKPQGPYDDPS